MKHHTDDSPEESSQVRNIIRQLNEDAPGKEKGREVVVRPDGSKMVRVTKKRKMMVTREEKNRSGRRLFMQSLFALLLILAGIIGFFFYRMSTMSGDQYLADRGQELQRLWGASSVRCTGAVIDGINFHISNVVAEFPESSMIERVELSELDSELDLSSFFTGVLSGDNLKVARAHIHLRGSARRLSLPQAQGEELWRFRRVSCPDFSVSFAGEEASPWSIRHSSAYMYRPSAGSSLTVVTLDGGTMQMRGWKAISIQSAKLHFSQLAVEDFSLTGTTDNAYTTTESTRSSIAFSGSLADGAELAGPYYFVADNMNFSEFSEGRFNKFFAARTVRPTLNAGAPSTQVRLPLDRFFPQFMGTFNLKDVSISGFPAMQMMTEHLEPVKRKRYLPARILQGTVRLHHDGAAMVLSFDESGMVERDIITLRGEMRVEESSELSGTLDYGIPVVLTRAEYRDGRPDPIFREDGHLAWVATKLSGPAAHPQDDSHELEAAAIPERANRERIPFEEIDLDRVNEFFRMRGQMPQDGGAPAPGGKPEGEKAPSGTTMPSAPNNSGLDPLAPGGNPLDAPF